MLSCLQSTSNLLASLKLIVAHKSQWLCAGISGWVLDQQLQIVVASSTYQLYQHGEPVLTCDAIQ